MSGEFENIERRQKRPLLAGVVRWFHIAIVLFSVIGPALPWRLAWMAHVVVIPVTWVHWRFNDGACILTTWERHLLADESEHRSGAFVRSLIQSVTGWDPPPEWTLRFMLVGMFFTFLVSVLRLSLG